MAVGPFEWDDWDKREIFKGFELYGKKKTLWQKISKRKNKRSMVERVNKYLKEDFGCSNIYYKGATKNCTSLISPVSFSIIESVFPA